MDLFCDFGGSNEVPQTMCLFCLSLLPSLHRVRRLQLCFIFLELAPNYLLTIFKQYVVLCEDFKGVGKKVDGKVVWDEKHRDWLIGQMKKKVNFVDKNATSSPVAEWEVSALCAALLAVSIPEDIAEEVKKVRESRNRTCHVKGASLNDLKTRVKAVESLIQTVKPSSPDQPWDDYLEELHSAADSELHSCYDMICRPLHEALVLCLQ